MGDQCNENGIKSTPLYDPNLLLELDFENQCKAQYNPVVSPQNPGEGLEMRPLCNGDYDKGYIDLLSQLTKVGNISRDMFEEQYNLIEASGSQFTTVVEDKTTNQIIGSVTVVKELKFIHQCSARGRIEDLVVNNAYRGKQLGQLLCDVALLMCRKIGCYKASWECLDKMVPFYKSFGLFPEEGQTYICCRFKE